MIERPNDGGVLPGFEKIRRGWKSQFNSYVSTILPGEYFVTQSNDGIETVLGSCVAACVRDRVTGIGGMNHFMLPVDKGQQETGAKVSDATRYGNFAMEHLINDVLKHGGRRENLEFKVAGGGRILNQMAKIGWYNIGFVFDYLFTEGFDVTAHDIGDIFPRKVIYFPATGVMKVKRLRSMHEKKESLREEKQYMDQPSVTQEEGEIELF
ncbi:MAG: chemoreceptor glutamine deamidase CheD [Gammaproteobacteria bacterium]|jgi:chemotaxis protein CheD|nr:chemoreceptor glutamine deamidase CheD [Gammaproteobacteria bacterium]MBT3489900.1 chemoreceptor glutamine deamidase CheD [Gammaproteobacteria bacterium]MBT3719241.1 chemoreceptor glutamine deamidase CheD [Gammaproteobacteria bacterium]MBT3846035.1 chemoreceptor glutamine deamidase CheD [Gammaproteobacteria bacterium]MBT3893545.1 chemoreceptor glutamine deamidase CheD [Gammaproteobacteria bacterium]